MTPFDYVNAINSNNRGFITNSENPPVAEKSYVPFVVNRAMSYFPDTIQYSLNMTLYGDVLSKAAQFDYYVNIVRPRKRFSKWTKKKGEDSTIAIIAEHYGISYEKAEQAVYAINDDQKVSEIVDNISILNNTGGKY